MIMPMQVSVYEFMEKNSADAYIFAAEEVR